MCRDLLEVSPQVWLRQDELGLHGDSPGSLFACPDTLPGPGLAPLLNLGLKKKQFL